MVGNRDAIQDAEEAREAAVRKYLQANGWRYTSEIGSLWLWTRVILGQRVYVNESSALWLTDNEYCEVRQ